MQVCPTCGKTQSTSDAAFCSFCGSALPIGATPDLPAPETQKRADSNVPATDQLPSTSGAATPPAPPRPVPGMPAGAQPPLPYPPRTPQPPSSAPYGATPSSQPPPYGPMPGNQPPPLYGSYPGNQPPSYGPPAGSQPYPYGPLPGGQPYNPMPGSQPPPYNAVPGSQPPPYNAVPGSQPPSYSTWPGSQLPPYGNGALPVPARSSARGLTIALAIIAALVVVTLLVGLGLIVARQQTKTSASTTAPVNLPHTWQVMAVPPGFDGFSFTVAPSNGLVAYDCVTKSTPPAVWKTEDGGAHWTQTAALPGSLSAIGDCKLNLDSGDARSLEIDLIQSSANKGEHFYTHDGGKTWATWPDTGFVSIDAIATYHGSTYAIYAGATTTPYPSLAVSHDGWKTWTEIDQQIQQANGIPSGFWVNQANGVMLVEAFDDQIIEHFWQSSDDGTSWTRLPDIPAPDTKVLDLSIVATPLSSSRTWVICVVQGVDAPATECTYDSGQHWKMLPSLTNPQGGVLDTQGNLIVRAQGSDFSDVFYRMGPMSTTWGPLSMPANFSGDLRYAPAPGPGVLWAVDESGSTLYLEANPPLSS